MVIQHRGKLICVDSECDHDPRDVDHITRLDKCLKNHIHVSSAELRAITGIFGLTERVLDKIVAQYL